MVIEFEFVGATEPPGLASTFTVERAPEPGERVRFVNGSVWKVMEVVTDIRASTNHIVVRVAKKS